MILTEKWTGIDLDGALARFDPDAPYDPSYVGDPVPQMVEAVRRMLLAGRRVKIFTARVSPGSGDVDKVRESIERWCQDVLGEKLEITATKDYLMTELWDDRAIQIIPNTGMPLQNLLHDAVEIMVDLLQHRGSLPSSVRERVEDFVGQHEGRPYVEER